MDIGSAVDAALRDLSSLLGPASSTPKPTLPGINPMNSPPAPTTWDGEAAQRASLTSAQLDEQRRTLYSAHRAAGRTITQAGQISTDARAGMDGVLADWANDKAALGPMSETPEGQAWLATAGQMRLGEADAVVRQAVSRFGEASQQLNAIAAGLPGGGVPLSPTDAPYPPGAPNADKINDLYQDLAELQIKIAAHNLHPPAPNDPAAVAVFNEEAANLMSDLLKLQVKFSLYGIDLIINPPAQAGN